MTPTKRLEEPLALKDRELEGLQEKLAAYEEPTEWRWMVHTDREEDTHDLPVPRLEMRCEPYYEDTWGTQVWTYSLVYRHLLGHLVWVPLGETRRTGNHRDEPPMLTDLPFRDGAHIRHDSEALRLPAFVVIGDRTQQIERKNAAGSHS